VDELGTLVVRALPGQFSVIEKMIRQLDQEEPGSQQYRVVRVAPAAGDPQAIVDRVQKLYAEQTKGMPADQAGTVSVEVDKAAGTLLISAGAGGMQQATGEEGAQQYGCTGLVGTEIVGQRPDVDSLVVRRQRRTAGERPLGSGAQRLGCDPEVLLIGDETQRFRAGRVEVALRGVPTAEDLGDPGHGLGSGRLASRTTRIRTSRRTRRRITLGY